MSATNPHPLFSAHPGRRALRALTLVEVMVSTTILTMVIVGLFKVLGESYQLNARARYDDASRAVLNSMADQFQRFQISEQAADGSVSKLPFFTPTAGPTGAALKWNGINGDSSGLHIPIGDSRVDSATGKALGASTMATVTRDVKDIVENVVAPFRAGEDRGRTSSGTNNNNANRIISCEFVLTYQLSGKTIRHAITVTRAIP